MSLILKKVFVFYSDIVLSLPEKENQIFTTHTDLRKEIRDHQTPT